MTDTEYASADAVAGLASEVERMRRAVDPLREIPGRVDALAGLVTRLADTVAALAARPGPTPAPSWLLLPADETAAAQLIDELSAWMRTVHLRYPDAVTALPECWLWHPDIVEELLWLMHAWCNAYQGKGASVALAGDWHDRQRPGVVRRIRQAGGSCSKERHMTRPGWDRLPEGPPVLPGVEAAPLIAAWWGPNRESAAPEPAEMTGRRYR